MSINPDHINFIMERDAEVRDGAEATLCAMLRTRDYIRTNGLQVKKFFADLAAARKVTPFTLYMSLSSWEARMSNANKVLTTFESADAPGWISAMANLHAWNLSRLDNGADEMWALQSLYAECGGKSAAGKPVAEVAETPAEVTEAVTADDTATTPLIDVMIANVQHLTADELVRLAAAIAERQTLVAVA